MTIDKVLRKKHKVKVTGMRLRLRIAGIRDSKKLKVQSWDTEEWNQLMREPIEFIERMFKNDRSNI